MSHFAPAQKPDEFNRIVLAYLASEQWQTMESVLADKVNAPEVEARRGDRRRTERRDWGVADPRLPYHIGSSLLKKSLEPVSERC